MAYTVRLETITDHRPLAVVRRLAKQRDLPRIVPEACGLVWNALKVAGIKGGRHVSIYYDNQMNVEVGAEVDAPFVGSGEVVASSIPTGQAVTTTHFGPYQQLGQAHQAIQDWCKQNGRETTWPNWEIYGHWQDAWNQDPSLIRTDVFHRLKA